VVELLLLLLLLMMMMTALVTVMYVFVHISLPCFVCGTRWIELSNMEPENTMNDQLESHLYAVAYL